MKWEPIETAPRDGTRFIGRGKRNRRRRTWFGKASHVPLYGWCWGRDVEDIDLWQPTAWMPLPEPPMSGDGK